MIASYPFAAIVGQDQLKTALLLCAVNPGIGGVLIRGDKGTAKSTAARGLAEVLMPIERVLGCHFNCLPGEAHELCDVCGKPEANFKLAPVPFVNLPLGATEDRVLGSLDFERALKDGRRAFQPGLLAGANRGILYIDEVNLLADHLVDVLLDVAATGVNLIQREGLSINHPAKFSLVGTMNLEEGDLRPQLLDRFGLMVHVEAPKDAPVRVEVVRRRMEFEACPEVFVLSWSGQQDAIRKQVVSAQALLPQVTMDDSLFNFISKMCCELQVVSLRADIVMNKSARALAALDGRQVVTVDDVRYAAELVLPHRRRCKPTDRTGLDSDRLDDLLNDLSKEKTPESSQTQPKNERQAPERSDNKPSSDQVNDNGGKDNESTEDLSEGPDQDPIVFGVKSQNTAWKVELRSGQTVDTSGRRSIAPGARRGQYVRAVLNEKPTNLAVDATLRHAVLRNSGELKVSRADLHQKIRIARHGNIVLLVVDSSGSMASLQRMEAVKGAVLSLLGDAYQRRDKVGVISCRGQQAELILAPTRSVEEAEQRLRSLPTGGRTPLAHALTVATETLSKSTKDDGPEPLLVILSDGKANVGLSSKGDPWQQSLQVAANLADLDVPALVVDTEAGFLRLGRARELADSMRAEYVVLDDLSAETLTLTIRRRLRGKVR
jgi:magnesium chelatase subunit D